MTIRFNRWIIALTFLMAAAFSAAAQHPLAAVYVGTWKGEMTVGRPTPMEFTIEPSGNTLTGGVAEGGKKVAFSTVLAVESGVTFRLNREEGSFMIFAGKLGPNKLTLSGNVDIYQDNVKRGTAPWKATKVVVATATATSTTPTSVSPTTRPPLAQQAYDRGLALVRAKNFRGAIPAFTECLSVSPKDAICLSLRGISYNRLSIYPEADADLTAAIGLSPKPPSIYYIERAEARLGRDESDAAIADADAAFKINAPPEAHLMRGRALLLQGWAAYETPQGKALVAKGHAEIDKFIQLKPQDHRGYLARGQHYLLLSASFREKTLDLALAELNKAVSLSPQTAENYCSRFRVHQSIGNEAEAAADDAKCKQLTPK